VAVVHEIVEHILATVVLLNAMLPQENDEIFKTKMVTVSHLLPAFSASARLEYGRLRHGKVYPSRPGEYLLLSAPEGDLSADALAKLSLAIHTDSCTHSGFPPEGMRVGVG
jgi:hypothetical protein